MKQVSITELKRQLSRYLRLVERGETIEILERSVPIARIEGIRSHSGHGETHLERLRRDGIVQTAKRHGGADSLKDPPIPCRGNAVRTIIDERGDR